MWGIHQWPHPYSNRVAGVRRKIQMQKAIERYSFATDNWGKYDKTVASELTSFGKSGGNTKDVAEFTNILSKSGESAIRRTNPHKERDVRIPTGAKNLQRNRERLNVDYRKTATQKH